MDKAFAIGSLTWVFADSEQSVNDFQNMIKTLMPTFNIVESVASTALESTKSYIQMTKQQASILHFLREQPTAVIHGQQVPSKTMLTIEKG